MANEIKTHTVIKNIKSIDKAANLGGYMKNTFIRSKDAAEETQGQQSPSEYAIGTASDHAQSAAQKTVNHVQNNLRNSRQKTRDNMSRTKQEFRKARQQLPGQRKQAAEQAKKTADTLKEQANQAQKVAQKAHTTAAEARQTFKQTRQIGRQTIQAAKQVKTTGKDIKTAKKSVKTSERTAKTAVKTAERTAKTTQKSAQAAVKAAKMAERASRAAAKAAARTVRATVRAVIAMVRAAIAAIKSLVTLIAAGGWVAVLIIIIICLIGLLAGSVFGVFFSSDNSGDPGDITITSAISQVNTDYYQKISDMQRTKPHDDYDVEGSPPAWQDVLAVYAVKTVTDSNNPVEVATMDDQKLALLKSVFWDMCAVSSSTETVTDQTGMAQTLLHITVTSKSAGDMIAQYGFTADQAAQARELLDPQYDSTWNDLIYGTDGTDSGGGGPGNENIVAVAASQIGNVNGQPYWSWYGFNSRVAWCACFVSWCADQCGYLQDGAIKKCSYVDDEANFFKSKGEWRDRNYTPAPGDIIFFDWDHDGIGDHIGIVEDVAGGRVHTIEGNTTNSVARRSYPLGSIDIKGYGTPDYNLARNSSSENSN